MTAAAIKSPLESKMKATGERDLQHGPGREMRVLAAAGWCVWLALAVALWPTLAYLNTFCIPRGVPPLARAEFLASSSPVPPPFDDGWQAVALPDTWFTRGVTQRQGWYRIRFRVESVENGLWALYLPSVSLNAAAYLNGDFIGGGGPFGEPLPRHWLWPLRFIFGSEHLRHGENVLFVHLASNPAYQGHLAPLFVAPLRALEPAYARRYALRVTALWGALVSLVLAGFFAAALATQYRRDPSFRWYALAAFAWAVVQLDFLVVDIPMPTRLWNWVCDTAAVCTALFMARYVLEFVGDEPRHRKQALIRYGLPAAVLLTTISTNEDAQIALAATQSWFVLGGIAVAYATARVVGALRRRPSDVEARALLLTALVVFSVGVHDSLVVLGITGAEEGYYGPYAAFLVVAGVAWVIRRRFAIALRESEALVVNLEGLVRTEHAKLAETYERMRIGERARILSEERDRVFGAMNDGLGAQLVSTLSLSESGDASSEMLGQAVRAALDDLRLTIDSLEPLEGELLPALGMLRTRIGPRIAAMGVRIEWRVADVPLIADLGPHRVLEILRILRHVFLTAAERPGVGTITVATREDRRDGVSLVLVEVSDDGRCAAGSAPAQRDMDSERRRAWEIGAEIELVDHTGAAGTTVRLWIPIAVIPYSRDAGYDGVR